MADLIDRQAALDAITDELMPSTPLSVAIRAKNRLKDLPAVQPDHNADIGKKASISCARENDVISREAAIDAVRKNTFRLSFAEEQNCEGHVAWSAEAVYSDVMEGALLELPSAQPARKKGRWLPDNRPGGGFWVCSECKFPSEAFAANVLYKFCPNCGADMRGGQDETD